MNQPDNSSNDPGVPSWLLILFFGSLVLGLGYGVFIHGFLNYDHQVAFRSKSAAYVVAVEDKIKRSPAAVAAGKSLIGRCAACHGVGLKGGPAAPNLVDGKWLHDGRTETSLYRLIAAGVIGKSKRKFGAKAMDMPARGLLGSNADVWRVVYYLSSVNPSIKKDAK